MKKKKGLPLNDPMDLYEEIIDQLIEKYDLQNYLPEFLIACEAIVRENKVDIDGMIDDLADAIEEFIELAGIEERE